MTRQQLKPKIGAQKARRKYIPTEDASSETLIKKGLDEFSLLRQSRLRQEDPPLPGPYNETKVVLLVRDPYWLYAYWEIENTVREDLIREYGSWEQLPLVLRVYDLSGTDSDTGAAGVYGAPCPVSSFDVPVSPASASWYIYAGEPGHCFYVELGVVTGSGRYHLIARSNRITTPADSVSDIVDDEWMVVDEHFQRLYRLAGLPGGASEALLEGYQKRLERASFAGSGAISSISSPMFHKQQQEEQTAERRFWLVLNTELIVYGATQPGARLRIQGQTITLQEDGTFALRVALPDGVHELPVTAVAPGGTDSINITPIITKQTTGRR
ncbi:MAG TPA: hypothetical protein DCY84_12545 [Firmicutes bacterium]|nr:hypothetical protein [Bacillota bacterium]HCM17024.1 hypothetical protein [Bacillota bacterium]